MSERALCKNCAETKRTSQDAGPCLDPEARTYYNCFNRISCEKMRAVRDQDVLQRVLKSGCLSCNFTTEERRIVEARLRGIIDKLDMMGV